MRTLFHVVFGAAGGLALGILLPPAMFLLMSWKDPVGMRQGGGTPFAIMMILTVPLGAVAGAVWGYQRSLPPRPLTKHGLNAPFAELERRLAGIAPENQRAVLEQFLPRWMDEYRQWLRTRLVVATVLLLVGFGFYLAFLLLLGHVAKTTFTVVQTRAVLDDLRRRWGDELFAPLEPLPMTLRSAKSARKV